MGLREEGKTSFLSAGTYTREKHSELTDRKDRAAVFSSHPTTHRLCVLRLITKFTATVAATQSVPVTVTVSSICTTRVMIVDTLES